MRRFRKRRVEGVSSAYVPCDLRCDPGHTRVFHLPFNDRKSACQRKACSEHCPQISSKKYFLIFADRGYSLAPKRKVPCIVGFFFSHGNNMRPVASNYPVKIKAVASICDSFVDFASRSLRCVCESRH